MYSFSYLEPVCYSMSSSNCFFLTCIQISQETGKVLRYSYFFRNFSQFVVICTVKNFGAVSEAEEDVFREFSCCFYDPIVESGSHSVVSDPLRPHGLYSPWNSPGQNTGVGSLSLFQRIFPTQGSKPSVPHWKWILYQLSHKGSPWILPIDFWLFCLF